jgi:hypothetical protein
MIEGRSLHYLCSVYEPGSGHYFLLIRVESWRWKDYGTQFLLWCDVMNSLFRKTINPKGGDSNAFNRYANNLVARMAPRSDGLLVSWFMWVELNTSLDDAHNGLPYAPYIMYIIEGRLGWSSRNMWNIGPTSSCRCCTTPMRRGMQQLELPLPQLDPAAADCLLPTLGPREQDEELAQEHVFYVLLCSDCWHFLASLNLSCHH